MREVLAVIEGVSERLDREHDELAWAAWHTAALMRQTKKMPDLAKMLSGRKRPAQRQDWRTQEAILSTW